MEMIVKIIQRTRFKIQFCSDCRNCPRWNWYTTEIIDIYHSWQDCQSWARGDSMILIFHGDPLASKQGELHTDFEFREKYELSVYKM